MVKNRKSGSETEMVDFIGDVDNSRVLIMDDLTVSGSTLFNAASECRKRGAKETRAFVTHLLAGDGFKEKIYESDIDKFYATNTIKHNFLDPICNVDISWYLAEVIRRTHNSESVSSLFEIKGF